jgi:hypothetical protein
MPPLTRLGKVPLAFAVIEALSLTLFAEPQACMEGTPTILTIPDVPPPFSFFLQE